MYKMLLWGLISTLSGVVTNFGGMLAIRFTLGFVEAVSVESKCTIPLKADRKAFLPGALLILSKWYTRKELAMRNAILFAGNLISNAFASLIGAGILSNMQGTLGHAAWRSVSSPTICTISTLGANPPSLEKFPLITASIPTLHLRGPG